jgi:hypothetical protein
MGAVRKRAVFWVAVLKRDHVPPVKDAIHPHPKNGAFWHMVVKTACDCLGLYVTVCDERHFL